MHNIFKDINMSVLTYKCETSYTKRLNVNTYREMCRIHNLKNLQQHSSIITYNLITLSVSYHNQTSAQREHDKNVTAFVRAMY